MVNSLFDIASASVTLAMAAVIACVRMPHDGRWRAMRRMNRLLFVCYLCISLSNIASGLADVGDGDTQTTCMAMLLVSMFQALLFTATCVTFVAPARASVRWLTANVAVITLVCAVTVYAFACDAAAYRWLHLADIVVYVVQLAYYCRLFWTCYDDCRRELEESYDEEQSGRLRWIRSCFLGALAVGLSALLFVVCRCGNTEYVVFTCVYTLYYVYLGICVVNYRIGAGYIVKVVAAETAMQAAAPVLAADDGKAGVLSPSDEAALCASIARWVGGRRFVGNDQTVEEIAGELGTTHAALKWYFTNRLHTNFRTWRIGLRIAEAQRLIKEEGASTATVHRMVGVADKSNFHKQFRQATGMTPKEYKDSLA